MNLIISSITIVDLTNNKAKKVCFSPNKNLLTSDQNHLGKSVIMKSLYYTLGAEVFFPAPIKRINLFTYIDFSLNGHEYRVCRLKSTFTLYCDNTFISYYSSVGEFEEALSELFNFEISLVGKDVNGSIIKCPPAFYFLPYYIDQENGWAVNSSSFNQIAQFDLPQRKSSYFFHFGVLDSGYVENSRRAKANERQKNTLERDNEKLKTVISTLEDGLASVLMSFDMSTLEYNIHLRQKDIKIILEEIAKIRKELVESEDLLIQLEHQKDVLSKYIKSKRQSADIESTETIECPRCGMFFERGTISQLEKLYLLESLNDDYTNISDQQKKLQKKIERLREKFKEKQTLLEEIERSLADEKEQYDSYIKSKATNQLLREYRERIGANTIKIDAIINDNAEIRKRLATYNERREESLRAYNLCFDTLLMGLDVPKDQVSDGVEPGTAISASGAYGPRCKLAQMLAFVELQSRAEKRVISFPIVIDSPNSLEQDKDNLESIIRTLMTWSKTNNQIIVASIEGKDIAAEIEGTRIIKLTNPKNQLLSSEMYCELEDEINDMFVRF